MSHAATTIREVPSSRLVKDADREFYAENGYWLGPTIFEPEELAALAEAQDEVNAGRYATGIRPMELGSDRPGTLMVRKIDGSHVSNDVIRAAATNRIIGQMAAELIGAPGIRLWHDQLLLKPVGGAAVSNIPWHQDYNYWRCSDRPRMITAWIPFHDADLQIGTMEFVVGSHQWGWNQHFSFPGDRDRDKQRSVIEQHMPAGAKFQTAACLLKAGQVSFHDCLMLHSSGPNFTNRPRRSLVAHLQSTECRWRAGVQGHMCEKFMIELGKKSGDAFDGPAWPMLWP